MLLMEAEVPELVGAAPRRAHAGGAAHAPQRLPAEARPASAAPPV